MLDRVNPRVARPQRGAAHDVDHVRHMREQLRPSGQIRANEPNPRALLGRQELGLAFPAGVQSNPLNRDGTGDGALQGPLTHGRSFPSFNFLTSLNKPGSFRSNSVCRMLSVNDTAGLPKSTAPGS